MWKKFAAGNIGWRKASNRHVLREKERSLRQRKARSFQLQVPRQLAGQALPVKVPILIWFPDESWRTGMDTVSWCQISRLRAWKATFSSGVMAWPMPCMVIVCWHASRDEKQMVAQK